VAQGIRKVVEELTRPSPDIASGAGIPMPNPDPTETSANMLKQQPVKPEPLVTPEDFT
jgi:hypothetical protein